MERVCSLKWKNHDITFLQLLNTLRKQHLYTDVVLACSGKFYNAHRLVLAACSDYFSQIFEHVDSSKPVVVLNDIKCTDLEALLDYMYTGEANVKPSDVASIIHAAESMEIKGLAVDEDEIDKIVKNTSKRSKRKRESSQHLNNDLCSSSRSKVLRGPQLQAINMGSGPYIPCEENPCQRDNASHMHQDEAIIPNDPLYLNETESGKNSGYIPDYLPQGSNSQMEETTLEEDSGSMGSPYQPNPECEYNTPSGNFSLDSELDLLQQPEDPTRNMEIIQLKTSKLARTYFIHDNHIYLSRKQRGRLIYMICICKRIKSNCICQAAATGMLVQLGGIISSVRNFTLTKKHNHEPLKNKLADLYLRRSCMLRAHNEDLPYHQIFNEGKERFPDATITFPKLKRTMGKFRGSGSDKGLNMPGNEQSSSSQQETINSHSIFGDMNDSEVEGAIAATEREP